MKYMKSIRLLLATGFCVTAFSAPLAGQGDASARGTAQDSAAVDTLAVRDSAALADSAVAPGTGLVGDSAAGAPGTGLVGDSAAADTTTGRDSTALSNPTASLASGLVGDTLSGATPSDAPPAAAPGAGADSDEAAGTGRPVGPAESGATAAGGQADSAAPARPVERGSVAGRAVRGRSGSAPLGEEAPERRARPLGTSYTTLSDMRAVFAPHASEPELDPEPEEEVEPDTTLAAVAQRFRPRAGEPIGLPTDPDEAARVSRANAPLTPALGTPWGDAGPGFVRNQLRFDRVLDARLDARFRLRALFREQGLSYPPRELFIRIFKQEQLLEVWVRDGAEPDAAHQLLKRYEICAVSGRLGPKRRFQDFQAPEGFYYIEGFNPQSEFHLSLRLNYPNPADRLLGMPEQLGGDIYIHGGCATAGCFPITDAAIKELYWLAVEARGAGQEVIPVHVFPTRMTDERMRWLRGVFRADGATVEFWKNLREGYDYFERTRTLPHVMIDGLGRYRISEPAAAPDSTAAAAAG